MLVRSTTLGAILVLLLAFAPLSVGAAPSDPFRGSWYATDVDGSNMALSFGGAGDTRRVRLFDDNATGGVCEDGDGAASGSGTGTVSGNAIQGTFDRLECRGGPGVLLDAAFLYVYDPATNTLTDGFVAWFRSGVTPSEPFLGAWSATDTGDGSNMTLSFAVPLQGGQNERMVTLYDDNATGGVCLAGEGRAMGSGIGVIDGNTISGTLDSLECLDGDSLEILDSPFEYVHDPITDTLGEGETWHRPSQGRTRAPQRGRS